MRQPELALEYGIDNLSECFAGVPDHVRRVIHLCCGYPNKLVSTVFMLAIMLWGTGVGNYNDKVVTGCSKYLY